MLQVFDDDEDLMKYAFSTRRQSTTLIMSSRSETRPRHFLPIYGAGRILLELEKLESRRVAGSNDTYIRKHENEDVDARRLDWIHESREVMRAVCTYFSGPRLFL